MNRSDIFLYGLVTAIFAIIVISVWADVKRNKKLAILWRHYQTSPSGGNKQKALKDGRTYYNTLRRGNIQPSDEFSIAKDMNAVK